MRSLTLLVTLPLIACGGDDDGGGGIKVVDASMQQQMDAPQAACAAQADYGTPTPVGVGGLRFCGANNMLVKCPATTTTGTTGTVTDPVMIVYVAQLNAQNDYLSVELWKGAPPFGNNPIGPAANVNLADAAQSQYASCGVCVYIDAQVNVQANTSAGTYLASSGTANITNVTMVADATMTKVAGSVSTVNMQHVDIAQGGMSTPSADGCTTKLASHSFDSAVRDPMMQLTGKELSAIETIILERVNARLRASAK